MKRSLLESLNKKDPAPAGKTGSEVPKSIDEAVAKYSGMSESELMNALLTETGRQKAEGRFDSSALRKGMSAILPMLNAEQKKKLSEIVGIVERQ